MEPYLKTVAIVQARMGSTRFPGKVMKKIMNVSMIELLLMRLSKSSSIDEIVVATPEEPNNKLLIEHVLELGFTVFQGSEDDVLDRYYQAAKNNDADIVVRITGDCPLVDSDLVDTIITKFNEECVDYYSNVLPPTFPDGMDVIQLTFQQDRLLPDNLMWTYSPL